MSRDGLAVTAAASKQARRNRGGHRQEVIPDGTPLRPAAEPNIRIWIITATQLQSAAADQNGGSARGYQAIFVPLAALSSPGYGLMHG